MTPFRKIYIAGRYARRVEFQQYAERLITQGHVITSTWLEEPPTKIATLLNSEFSQIMFAKRRSAALQNLSDIAACDMFIAFSQPRNDIEIGVTRGGRHFEAGYMYARIEAVLVAAKGTRHLQSVRYMLVGRRENVFEFSSGILGFETFDELYAYLDTEIEQALH